MEIDWFPETVVRKAEDDTPAKKGSKYGVVPLPMSRAPVTIPLCPNPTTEHEPGKPYFTPGGTLVVPMDALPRYRWWACGILLEAIIAETAGLACPVNFTDQ